MTAVDGFQSKIQSISHFGLFKSCILAQCCNAVVKWKCCSPFHDCFVYFLSGALNPLSAAAAAAAAAGRVALAGQAGSSGVLLVSNLNEEVSNTHTSQIDNLRLTVHPSYPPPSSLFSYFFFFFLLVMASCPPCAPIFIVLSVTEGTLRMSIVRFLCTYLT